MGESLTYSIRELEAITGISTHTIRTWERRYCLFSPERTTGNVRCYDASDIAHLQHLSRLLKQGHRISALAGKTREEIAALAAETSDISADSGLTQLICVAMQEFDNSKVEQLVRCYIRKEGFEQAFITRFIPFLDQLSFLLFTGALRPVHVRIFSSVLRQRIYVETDGLVANRDSERWLLLHDDHMTDSVYHDVMHYILRRAGHQVILSGNLHPEELEAMLQKVNPDGYCLVISDESSDSWLEDRMHFLSKDPQNRGKTLVLAPGKTLEFVNNSQISNSVVLGSLREAFQFLYAQM